MSLAKAFGAISLMAISTVASAQWLDGASDSLAFDIRVSGRESAAPMLHVAVRDLETGKLSQLPPFAAEGRSSLNISEQRPWDPAICPSSEGPPLGLCVNIIAVTKANMTAVEVYVLASRHRVPIYAERAVYVLTSNNAFERSVEQSGQQWSRPRDGARPLLEMRRWPAAQLGR